MSKMSRIVKDVWHDIHWCSNFIISVSLFQGRPDGGDDDDNYYFL
jgi:hypothetical protein